jgi:hypothetical protein
MATVFRRVPLVFIFALVSYLSLFKGAFDHIADDPGLGWHLANGSVIAETGSIPREDPFLAPPLVANPYVGLGHPRPWINEQWLGDLGLFELFSRGGWPLVYGVIAGLYLIAYFGVAADSLRRSGEGRVLVLCGIVLAFKLGQVHLIVRPVLFSIVLFSIFISRAGSLITREEWSRRIILREALLLGGLVASWANIHPAFIYAFVVLGCAMLSLLVAGPDRGGNAKRLAALSIVCVVASSCNPFGFHLYESIGRLGGSSALRGITNEWSPVDPHSVEGQLLLLLMLIPCVCVLISARMRQGIGLFELLLAVFFTSQALWAVRVVPFASLACLPLWAACFGGKTLLPARSSTALTRRVLQRIDQRESTRVAPGMISSSLIAVCGLIAMVLAPTHLLPTQLGSIYERQLPTLFATPNVPFDRVVYASPDWGGAITHLMWPQSKAVLDDRTVVVGEALYQAYSTSLRDPEVFQELARVFGVTDVLAPGRSALASYLGTARGWRRGGEAGDTVLYSRDVGSGRES